MLKIRASALGAVMSEPKSIDPALLVGEYKKLHASRPKDDEAKAAKEAALRPLIDRTLSAGAKTFVENEAKQFVYGYRPHFSSRETDKGTIVEGQSIELYNSVFFTDHKKNTERRTNEWITGEPDIVCLRSRKIKDIKSSWSLATFPAIRSQGESSLYEWQLRAYMMLWPDEVDGAELAYCMVSTPEELIGYEPESLHLVEEIDPMLRITRLSFVRDLEKEDLIKTKCKAAQAYYELVIEQITQEHA